MKFKNKILKSLLLLICLTLPLNLFACSLFETDDTTPEIDYTISTPKFVNLISLDDTNQEYYTTYENLALVAEENPTATGYAFYFYGGNGDSTNLTLYTRFKTTKNYIELKDVFGANENQLKFEQKRYHYYVVALGGYIKGELYNDSPATSIKFIDFKARLVSPSINLNPNTKMLGWTTDENASHYEVFEGSDLNNETSFNKIYSTADNTINFFDLNSYLENKVIASNFKVRAIAKDNSNFLDSAFSEIITYNPQIDLYNPQSLNIETIDNIRYLTWESVENAESYTVIIDENEYTTTDTKYNIENIFQVAGQHTLSVKSYASNPNFILDENVMTLHKHIQVELNKPSSLNFTQTGDIVNISWNKVQNAQNYKVIINDVVWQQNCVENSISVDISSLNESVVELTVQICANGYGDYLTSDYLTNATPYKFITTLKMPTINSISLSENNSVILDLDVHKNDKYIRVYSSLQPLHTFEIELGLTNVKLDLRPYLTEDKVYSISANSISYNEYTLDGEKTLAYSYKNIVPFASPTITSIKLSENRANILVEWLSVEGATEYNVYVNDVFYKKVEALNVSISKDEVSTLEGGGYNINVQAVGNGEYLDSILGENVFYKGYDGLDLPSGIKVSSHEDGFIIEWDAVSSAETYTVAIDNTLYTTTETQFIYETDENIPYQIMIKANNLTETSDYTEKIMYNNLSVHAQGYTDSYVYFNGWHDFYINSQEEFTALCKYAFFSYKYTSSPISMYIGTNFNITSTNWDEYFTEAAKTFGTNAITVSPTFSLNVLSLIFTYDYDTDEPPTTSTNSDYVAFENQGYYTATTKTRSDDYNNFTTETSLIEMTVSNTNELYICAEGKAKPVFTENNYQAEESYEEAKKVLRNIISDDMTDFEKTLAIYDYINYISVYDSFSNQGFDDRRFWLNGPLLAGVGVCDGFSKLFSLLCNMEGIDTIKISGLATQNNTQVNHAWNKVSLDLNNDGEKEWYNVDLTWDGLHYQDTTTNQIYEFSTHKYFLLTDSEFTYHEAYDDPYVANTKFDFYSNFDFDENGNDLYIETITELLTYFEHLKNNTSLFNGFDVKIDSSISQTTIAQLISSYNLQALVLNSNIYIFYV